MELLEFCKQFKVFKPTHYQELILEHLAKGGKLVDHAGRQNWYKQLMADEISCSKLLEMEEGQRFVLVSPDGARVFVLSEIRPIMEPTDAGSQVCFG